MYALRKKEIADPYGPDGRKALFKVRKVRAEDISSDRYKRSCFPPRACWKSEQGYGINQGVDSERIQTTLEVQAARHVERNKDGA